VKKRLFIAVDLSEAARRAAADHIVELSERFPDAPVKWERPDKLHLTLKFLGSVEEALVPSITRTMEASVASAVPFLLGLVGTGAFPSAQRPRILWIGVSDVSRKLRDLALTIDQACSQLGFAPESRRFRPHLTLARVRHPQSSSDIGRAHVSASFGPIEFICGQIVLYESQLGQSGSTYSKLHTAAFEISS
jgi:2'-5' RNA ligase